MPLAIGLTAFREMRVSAALPAAGAWDAAPLEIPCAGAESMTLQCTYTRGGAGGAFDIQFEPSIYSVVANVPAGASEWSNGAAFETGVVAAGVDVASLLQQEVTTYTSQGAAAEPVIFGPIELGGDIERIRINARESGAVGTPGTLQIQAQFT